MDKENGLRATKMVPIFLRREAGFPRNLSRNAYYFHLTLSPKMDKELA
jgi:hypothetical protein